MTQRSKVILGVGAGVVLVVGGFVALQAVNGPLNTGAAVGLDQIPFDERPAAHAIIMDHADELQLSPQAVQQLDDAAQDFLPQMDKLHGQLRELQDGGTPEQIRDAHLAMRAAEEDMADRYAEILGEKAWADAQRLLPVKAPMHETILARGEELRLDPSRMDAIDEAAEEARPHLQELHDELRALHEAGAGREEIDAARDAVEAAEADLAEQYREIMGEEAYIGAHAPTALSERLPRHAAGEKEAAMARVANAEMNGCSVVGAPAGGMLALLALGLVARRRED